MNSDQQEMIYEQNAVYYPEYTKIVAITHATTYWDKETNEIKRKLNKIVDTTSEAIVIETFLNELNNYSKQALQSESPYVPILCGHNIVSYDIPLIIKRYMLNKKAFKSVRELSPILVKSLNIKPWESGIIDTANAWKFNGFDTTPTPLMLISDYLGLKKTVDLLPLNELSKNYWENIHKKPQETMDFISLQSATQTNLVIQLIKELRLLSV